MVTMGILTHKEKSHGRARNRTRNLLISSQKLRPLDHEAGHYENVEETETTRQAKYCNIGQ